MINPLILLVLSPLLGVLVLLFIPNENKKALRWVALLSSLLTFALAISMLLQFNKADPNMQLGMNVPWITLGTLSINLNFGVDGISILLLLLTAVLTPVSLLSTWTAVEKQVKGFMIAFLLLEVGMLGVFTALDLILFYVFWEFTLIPMYFLIGIWGGERRIYAAIKFILFTMAGSLLMLLAIIVIGNRAGSFQWADLVAGRQLFADIQPWLFLAFALAFAIKVPIFPLHTWLPDAHVESPTAGSVILAGVLLKMGTYGFVRFNLPLFPETFIKAAPWIGGLAVIGILYGAAVSYFQKDMKKLVAYSSVSHLGFVMLGLFALTPIAVSGAVLQMINHGLSTGALFLMVGLLYERRHTREMSQFGGVWKVVPLMGAVMLIVTLSSAGLPALNGFIGEFTILLGSYGSQVLGSPWFTILGTLGVILAAVYLLVLFEKVYLGPIKVDENRGLKDMNAREIITLLPLLVLIFWIGLYPKPFFALIDPAVQQLLQSITTAAAGL
ncbi:MAG TPA: NADH-quinone oxidoreductase subunit M [Bellilinea sp.]|nr:NADH-quinone oxidoreductase subunit M [Bellilinea sp.]